MLEKSYQDIIYQRYQAIDNFLISIFSKLSTHSLRWSIGIVFIWFGALKLIGLSPAEQLIIETVSWIFNPQIFLYVLGVWEILIGIFFIIPRLNRIAIFLLALQIPGTMFPLVFLPNLTFTHFPYALTLEGQYIIKNLLIIAVAITIGSRVKNEHKETIITES
jgi:uncharacterized membrane protein YkgB